MKPINSFIALAAAFFVALSPLAAQQNLEAEFAGGLKHTAGEYGFGFRTTGLKGFLWDGADADQDFALQFRLARTQSTIFRADLDFSFNSDSETSEVSDTSGFSNFTEVTDKQFRIGISPGFEHHFPGTRRLDPYAGAALPIFFEGKRTQVGVDEDVYSNKDFYKVRAESTLPGGLGLGLNGFVGANYFVADRLAVGMEYNIGLSFSKTGGKATNKVTVREKNGAIETKAVYDNEGEEPTVKSLSVGNFGRFGLHVIFYLGN